MKHINQLIETVYDETGIQGIALVISRNDDGWTARVVEDGHTLLCSAGEQFLISNGNATMEAAIESVDEIARRGYEMYTREAC